MKKIKTQVLGLVIFATFCLLIHSCDVDDGSYTKPISLYEKVNGNWNLSRMKQVDEVAIAAGTGTTELDITSFFQNFSISLNVDDNMKPTTFTANGGPNLIPTSGYWTLEKDFQQWDGTPVALLFFSDDAHTQKIGSILISAVPGSSASMELRLTRKAKGVPFVSYVYTLIPINN